MELLGGLLVLLVITYVSMSICAGGLCAGKDATKERGGIKR